MVIDGILQDIIVTIIVSIGSYLIYRWFSYFLSRTRERLDLEITFIQVIREIIKYSIIALAITVILKEIGVDIGPIIISLGIVGVAVAFAARDTLSNIISGMFILASKSFLVGDTIEISGHIGKVKTVGLRVTTMTTPNNKVIIIPNSAFSKSPYINFTALDQRRVDLNISIPYSLDLEELIPALIDSSQKLPWALREPQPKVLIKELTDMGVKATLSVWTTDVRKVATYKSELAQNIKGLLVEANE